MVYYNICVKIVRAHPWNTLELRIIT